MNISKVKNLSGRYFLLIPFTRPPEKLSFLRAKFNMGPYHNNKYHQPGSGSKIGFSAVDVVLVYPVFETHLRYFAREMMRLSGSNSLVWMTAYRNKWVCQFFQNFANVLLSSFVNRPLEMIHSAMVKGLVLEECVLIIMYFLLTGST